ncbi:NAD(P)/FAD-dependent oxidoreductase [Sphingobium sp.]|uniref:flavin-containing monooxygenase n=1 Tax=Sphingobium sp. TaxID=1912891 RepID=UPI002CF69305|nr:NAD(P)/FAD-dependent oxidoreductase [Sphingobium sp.]HUD90710.1 NAD(P)/FAD-dependent oxidoreductase [Sphingobium sp.]
MNEVEHHEAIVIGAGFSGIGMLNRLKGVGVNALCLEAGGDVGGVWYWNKYPGARTDSEAWYYCFSVSDEIGQEWDWTERYPAQGEVRKYLSYAADKFDVRDSIVFNAKVDKAAFDPVSKLWTVEVGDKTYSCRFLISAMGILSSVFVPPFPGLDEFDGRVILTARWPDEEPDFNGRRVGLIGTGATGVQITPMVSQVAKSLTVFQRTANFIIPAQNHELDDDFRADIKARYPEIWRQADRHAFAMPFETTGRLARDFSDEQRHEIFEEGWRRGGFRFLFETFDDILTDDECNAAAVAFIHFKIRSIVEDPAKAELLCPKDHPYGSKRPPAGHGYYEAYNNPNVSLVDISKNKIARVVPQGLQLDDGTIHEFDDLIVATGFDAFTGALTSVDIRGVSGTSIAEKWTDGAKTLFGIATHDFPNFFMITGPLSTFGNVPSTIESNIAWIGDAIEHVRSRGDSVVMEVSEEAEVDWANLSQEVIDATLIREGASAHSWILGANIPGKKVAPVAFLGGYNNYVDMLRAESAPYPKFELK